MTSSRREETVSAECALRMARIAHTLRDELDAADYAASQTANHILDLVHAALLADRQRVIRIANSIAVRLDASGDRATAERLRDLLPDQSSA